MSIEVVEAGASTMYLGKVLCLIQTHDVELKHRSKKAWANFGVFKK